MTLSAASIGPENFPGARFSEVGMTDSAGNYLRIGHKS
jgi:hypothetical protein